jgi:predicted GIY-YIG superfamily endonuclease
MYYVYILLNVKNESLYIGLSRNPKRRLAEHNSGMSFYTKRHTQWTPVYVEGYASLENAQHREKTLKSYGKVYGQLKRRIKRSIAAAQKVRG